MSDNVNHPKHYGGDTTYETIKVIEAWGLGFCLGNTVKYISRAGQKGDAIEDLEKAKWYLSREIEKRKKELELSVAGSSEPAQTQTQEHTGTND